VEEFIPGERKLRSDERNIFVYDIDSGLEVTSIKAGYLVSAVRLAGNGTLLSVSGDDTHNNRDPLRIWDIHTGKLVREITNSQEGIHHALEVSADGRIAVASIGLEQYKAPFLWMEGVSVHKNDRLRLWDLSTGKVLATTPFLHTVLAGAPLFRLSPDGTLLVVNNGGALSIFKLNIDERRNQ
jgi:WD40 repeat protein